jgi:hypothetical protein
MEERHASNTPARVDMLRDKLYNLIYSQSNRKFNVHKLLDQIAEITTHPLKAMDLGETRSQDKIRKNKFAESNN